MARRVRGAGGTREITLPGGWVLAEGDTVVIPDAEWATIASSPDLSLWVTDLGVTADPVDPVPTWRDIQRTIGGTTPPAPTSRYVHEQTTPAATWTVQHNLGTKPGLTLFVSDAPNEPVWTDLTYPDDNTVVVEWPEPTTGFAYA